MRGTDVNMFVFERSVCIGKRPAHLVGQELSSRVILMSSRTCEMYYYVQIVMESDM